MIKLTSQQAAALGGLICVHHGQRTMISALNNGDIAVTFDNEPTRYIDESGVVRVKGIVISELP